MGGGEVHLSSSNSGPPSLVQIFASAACRLLFITTENAHLMVVTVLKIVFCILEFALSNSVTVLFVSGVVSMEINRRHYFWRDLHNCSMLLFQQWNQHH